MASEIVMPKLSDTMTEGVFGSWKKSVGDPVQRGEAIAEVETDKAVMDLEAFSSGVLLEQRVHAGELVPVGTVIGLIGAPGELPAAAPQKLPEAVAAQFGIGPERVMEAPLPVMPEHHDHHDGLAAPVVRRKAREMGIDLEQVDGSGPGGRVLLEDLEQYAGVSLAFTTHEEELEKTAAVRPQSAEPESHIYQGKPVTSSEQPLSRMRTAIARTVEQAWRTIPHFYETVEVQMDAAMEVRRELKLSGAPVSVNDLVLKGSALALLKHPLVNASFVAERIVLHQEINIGMAVSLPEGLLVPVLRGCQGLSLKEIAVRSRSLADSARNGRLSEAELAGGTFSVSNLGMFGIQQFAAVIMPPQAAILAVGAVRETVLVKHDQPVVGTAMQLTLSADHRLLDGAYAAAFLQELKNVLENPVKLLL